MRRREHSPLATGSAVHDGAVFDPDEGVAPDGTIRTGVGRHRVPAAFEPLLSTFVAAASREVPGVSIYLYGSVATGRARVGTSDVDLLTVGLPPEHASGLSRQLNEEFAGLSRGVEVGPADPQAFIGEDDETYGNRVFLRHYCTHLAGPDLTSGVPAFAADAHAARGFNGDIRRRLVQWRAELSRAKEDDPALGRRVARKTLFAVAGLVSVEDGTWTTDREFAAHRWADVHPLRVDSLTRLYRWSEGAAIATRKALDSELRPGGTVEEVAERFHDAIGFWP